MIDYELVDSGGGRRLERFGRYLLDRPDPEVLWQKNLSGVEWQKADAKFDGRWKAKNVPERWQIMVGDLKFWLKLAPFKHTGIFPEQDNQWGYIANIIKSAERPINVLNLFAYTGVSSIFAAKVGAKVTHVDASKPAITWARENRDLNGMQDAQIRWIVDDALKFTGREIKRGVKYDAIIMDPPVYGHGPTGVPWDFSRDLPKLLGNCKAILSDKPLFTLINAYAVSTSATTLSNVFQGAFGSHGGRIESGELTLREKSGGRLLSTGIWAKWSQ